MTTYTTADFDNRRCDTSLVGPEGQRRLCLALPVAGSSTDQTGIFHGICAVGHDFELDLRD
jgi:hypothetical protein